MNWKMNRIGGSVYAEPLVYFDNKNACIHNSNLLYSQLHQPRDFIKVFKYPYGASRDVSDFQGSSAKEIQMMRN